MATLPLHAEQWDYVQTLLPADLLEDLGHRIRLSRPGNAQQNLVRLPVDQAPGELFDSIHLIATGGVRGNMPEVHPKASIAALLKHYGSEKTWRAPV